MKQIFKLSQSQLILKICDAHPNSVQNNLWLMPRSCFKQVDTHAQILRDVRPVHALVFVDELDEPRVLLRRPLVAVERWVSRVAPEQPTGLRAARALKLCTSAAPVQQRSARFSRLFYAIKLPNYSFTQSSIENENFSQIYNTKVKDKMITSNNYWMLEYLLRWKNHTKEKKKKPPRFLNT